MLITPKCPFLITQKVSKLIIPKRPMLKTPKCPLKSVSCTLRQNLS